MNRQNTVEATGLGKKATREGLDRAVASTLPQVLVILAGLLTLLTPVHWFFLPEPANFVLAVGAAASVLLVAGIAWFTFRRPAITVQLAHPIAALAVVVSLANAALTFAWLISPMQTTNYVLIVLGSGLLLLSRRWWVLLAALTWGIWFLQIRAISWNDEWKHFAFFLLSTTALGYAILITRIRTQTELVRFRHGMLQAERQERLRAEREIREKDRVLSTLISNLAGVVYRCKNDRPWTMEYLSEGMLALTGYAPEEFLNQSDLSYADLIADEDRATVWRQVQDALAICLPFQLTYRIRHRNGDERWIWEQGRGVFTESGELEAIEGFIYDITARKRAELELARSESRLRLALEASDVGIWDYDVASGRLEWTEGMSRLFGMSTSLLSGHPKVFWPYIPREDQKRIDTAARNALENQRTFEIEYRAMPSFGGERWIAARGHVWRDNSGKATRLMGYAQNTTDRRSYEDELRRSKERAEEANRLKSSIFANMSHEIRTPMTAILGYSEILARKLKGTSMVKDAEVINLGGKRLLKLLNNILDLARLEAGKSNLSITGHPISESLSRAVELLRVLAEEKGINLSLNVDPSLLVAGDLQAEEQIWTNILGNAIKFTEQGSVRVEATVAANPAFAQISITDTGVGISAEFLPHIFEEFRQESEGLGRQFEGTGLGLAISRRLVEALGGTIAISSNRGAGTTVTICLPLTKAATKEEALQKTPPIEAPFGPIRPQLLLVEDEPSNGRLVSRVLGDIVDVTACGTADEGLQLAAQADFDVIILDINLKGSTLSGEATLDRLRMMPAYQTKPVLAVTAYAMDGDEQRFLAGGFDGYLSKPFSAGELRNFIMRAVAKDQAV